MAVSSLILGKNCIFFYTKLKKSSHNFFLVSYIEIKR